MAARLSDVPVFVLGVILGVPLLLFCVMLALGTRDMNRELDALPRQTCAVRCAARQLMGRPTAS